MLVNGISSAHLNLNANKQAKSMTSLGGLYTGVQSDSFNGKTLKTSQRSLLDVAIEFGKKKRKKKPKQKTNNNGQDKTIPGFPELTMKPGPHGVAPKQYRNLFDENLIATPNLNLKAQLKKDRTIYNADKAFTRITSLSRYLKEDMIGFITPSGYHWFEGALENFIHGAKAKRVPKEQFKDAAKELWSLIAKADPYWTSDNFIKYLENMKPSAALDATIQAIKEIKIETKVPSGNISFGYRSELKFVKKLLEDGCAYTGMPMNYQGGSARTRASAEHIFPHSKGGNDNDLNFLMAAAQPNADRGNIPLVDFLKGKSAND